MFIILLLVSLQKIYFGIEGKTSELCEWNLPLFALDILGVVKIEIQIIPGFQNCDP